MNITYEVRYGTELDRYKVFKVDSRIQAYRLYDKVKRFAEKHNLTLAIALYMNFEGNLELLKTTTINPTEVTLKELFERA